ncbi:hypothetical protein KVV02_000742 [Mortierella alpina]|uniref:Voltage-gated hydrogen channel 1 n=1 Tax=Mortierella alpina TaxID=64518 RepID=A0A9P8D0S2_MORAP|nr:hypothetical protein KVV02_000742 [Mortierella alpina]
MDIRQQDEMKEVVGYSGAAYHNPAQEKEEKYSHRSEQLQLEQRLQYGEQRFAARNEPPLRRIKTCPAPQHTTFVDCSYADRMGTEASGAMLDPTHSQSMGHEDLIYHHSGQQSWFLKTRQWIGARIESKRAHIIILVLTLVDIILVVLQIGASLLHLDETKEEIWIIALFGHLSLAIISIFMLEILLKFFAFGPRYFWRGVPHGILHLVDAAIIITSFILELILKGAEQELTNLLIIFRLWRVIKLTGTVAIEVSEHDQLRAAILQDRVHSLEVELEDSRAHIRRLETIVGSSA